MKEVKCVNLPLSQFPPQRTSFYSVWREADVHSNNHKHVPWLYCSLTEASLCLMAKWIQSPVLLCSHSLLCPITGHPAVSPSALPKCLKDFLLQLSSLFTYVSLSHWYDLLVSWSLFFCADSFLINYFVSYLLFIWCCSWTSYIYILYTYVHIYVQQR